MQTNEFELTVPDLYGGGNIHTCLRQGLAHKLTVLMSLCDKAIIMAGLETVQFHWSLNESWRYLFLATVRSNLNLMTSHKQVHTRSVKVNLVAGNVQHVCLRQVWIRLPTLVLKPRGVLVFLKFGKLSSELTKTWSSGATECRVWIGNCNVKVWKSTEHKLHKIWHSLKLQQKRAHPRGYITRNPKQGNQWPHKKNLCPPKILTKKLTSLKNSTDHKCHLARWNFHFPRQKQVPPLSYLRRQDGRRKGDGKIIWLHFKSKNCMKMEIFVLRLGGAVVTRSPLTAMAWVQLQLWAACGVCFTLYSQCLVVFPSGFSSTLRRLEIVLIGAVL